jgi:hypothetical protein
MIDAMVEVPATSSLADLLASFAAPASGGLALGTAAGYLATALARDLGYEVSYGEWVAKTSGLGAIFGLVVEAFSRAGVH